MSRVKVEARVPKVGDLYGQRDYLSRYRIEVLQVDLVHKRPILVKNVNTGRRHRTSVQQLATDYRLVKAARDAGPTSTAVGPQPA